MVGWFYINEEVAAPVRMLESDTQSGILTIEVAARFIPNRTMLRGKTIVEYRHWAQRRIIRCLGAERVGSALMIEAVDVGPAKQLADDPAETIGTAEDWLTIDGQAYCQITGLHANAQPTGHCLFQVALPDWRDLRIGDGAPLAPVGISLQAAQDNDGSITPLLHCARELPVTMLPPSVEIVRLRERQRLTITPIATDWGDETTLVVARIHDAAPLRRSTKRQAVSAR